MPADALVGTPEHVDLMWCNLVGHYLDGCDPAKQKGLPAGATNCLGRTTCAYSYLTPLRHMDDNEIQMRNQSKATGANSTASWWLDTFADKKAYAMMPSWRPKGSYLRSAPCWTTSTLKDALVDWTPPARVPQVSAPVAKKRPPGATML